MKKYSSLLAICFLVSFGFVFGAPEDHDESFQTFNEIGVTNTNIGSNGVINVTTSAPGGKFFIGGDFTLYKGTTVNRFARINSDGSLDTNFSLIVNTAVATAIGFNGAINTIAIAPGATEQKYTVFVGGAFTQVRGKVQNRFAKIDCTPAECRLDTVFIPHLATNGAVSGSINAIAFAPGGTADNYQVIIGGLFPKFNTVTQNNISRFTCTVLAGVQTCSLDPNTFTTGTQTGTTGAINAMVFVPGGTATEYSIIIGGALTKYNNQNQKYLSKIDCTAVGTCTLDTSFVGTTTTDGANNIVNTIAVLPNGDSMNYGILIGGAFTGFYDVNPTSTTGANKLYTQNRLAKILCDNSTGSHACSLEEEFTGTATTDGANNAVESLVVYNNGIVVLGGAFTTYDGQPRNRLAQLDAGGQLDEGFYNILPFGPDNTIQNLLIQTDGKIIVSGLFDSYNGLFAGRIVRLLGMTSSYSAEGCGAGLFYCGFDNSCVANASQCASCPADFIQRPQTVAASTFVPKIVPQSGQWNTTPLRDATMTRVGHALVMLNNKIYLFGGHNTVVTEVYDPAEDKWATLSPYPVGTATYGIMAATVRGKIYTFFNKDTYEYNPVSNTWSKKASIPTAKRMGSAEVIDDKIYIVEGGTDLKFHIYDPLLDNWSTGPDLPTKQLYNEGIAVNGQIYIVGGSVNKGSIKTVYAYDPCSQRWIKKTDLPTGSGSHSMTAVNGDIFIGGGVAAFTTNTTVSRKLIKYDTLTGQTTTLPDAPFPSYHQRSVTIGGYVYIMGGAGEGGSSGTGVYMPSKKIAVYNTGLVNTKDPNISACSCQPACGEGKYYSVRENICRPNNELVGENFCNKNNVCEAGESCNCGDCTNGGLDDKDACGLSNGVQMYCSQDDEFYFPSSSSDIETFTNGQEFLSTTKSSIFDYSYKVPAAKRFSGASGVNSQVATVPFGPPSNITLISKGGGGGSTYGTDYVWFSYGKVPGNSIFNTMASMSFNTEAFDLKFPNPVNAFGIEIYEMHNPPAGFMGCNTTCVESTFSFRLLKDGVEVSPANNLTFAPANNTDQFFGFSTPFEFDEVQIREKVGSHDNERFGRIYYQDRSAGAQQCETKKVLMTSTAEYPDNSYMIFYDYVPREVNYNGKKIYVYNPIGNTTQSLATITANPSLAYSKIRKFTTPFQFMDHKLTPANSVNIFKDTGFSPVPSALLCFIKPDGTERCQYNNAQVGYPVFAKTPSTGSQTDLVYATSRDDTGSVTYGKADIVRAFNVEICQPTGADICTIGACCPGGTKWDCDTNSCVLDEFMCSAGQVETVAPGSTVCLLSISPTTSPNGSKMILTGYNNLQGNCTLAGQTRHDIPAKSISSVGSTALSVSRDINTITAMTESSFALVADAEEINPLLTCPANHVSQCFRGDGDGSFLCGCYPVKSVKMIVNITDSTNTNRTTTLGDGTKIQNNTPITLFASDSYILDTVFTGGDTTDMGIKRQTGYVEFYTHDRLNYNVGGTLRGTITLSGAKILGVDAPYQKSASLNLEAPNGDFVTQISDSTVNFYSYFSEPGDKWKIYYEIPENVPINPEYICEIQGCSEGEYFCHVEGICKGAEQTCGAVTCNSDGTCDEDESCDCADCNSQIDHCGVNPAGQQLFCTKDVLAPATTSDPSAPTSSPADKWEAYSYSSAFIFLAKHPITSYTSPGTFQVYNPERIIFNMTEEQFMQNPTAAINNARVIPVGRTRVPTSRLQFNMPQLLSETATAPSTIANLKSGIQSRFLCKTPGVASTDCHVNNLGAFIPAFSYTPTGDIYSSYTDGAGGVGMTKYTRFGTFNVACQAYDYTTVRYIPNTDPRSQDWSNINGIGTKQKDGSKLVWQVADGGTSEGKNAVIYKRLAQSEIDQFLTKGGKVTASIKNISAGLPTGSAAGLLASYFELARGNVLIKSGSLNGATRTPKRFTFVFALDADKTPTIIGLNNAPINPASPDAPSSYINPIDSVYKYRVEGGASQYHTYEMLYKPTNDSVDLYVDGIKQISDFPGNEVAPGYASQLKGNVGVFFGSGSSPGTATTNYGEIKLTIKNDLCSAPVAPVSQVGACCPLGTAWNSQEEKCVPACAVGTSWDEAQNKCTAPTCAEGQYYCHSELKCKPANQACGTVTCNNNGTCNEFESCDCADCNGQIDHCGVANGEQLFCTKDPAPQCYTDRFPYCFPLCLDGYTLDTATNQCVVSGGASVSPSSDTLATTQIGACCPAGAQWNSANNKCETNCTTTQAPSELKAGVDQPYISCTAGPTGTTHFKYRLTDTSAPTATPFISAIYSNGTQVLHPVINTVGNYKVECFYGNATSVDTSNTATPSTCVKNIAIKNDANTQGCEGLVSYKGTTLTTTLEDTSGFTARFQCINRVSENPAVINPFRIQYANNIFRSLGFATIINPNLSSSIGLNRLSAQDQYSFELGNTSVTCAVKVGTGYSTNASCQKNACVGGNCSTPQTFSVVHSDNLTCTTQATAEYKIGCNPDAPDSNKTECVNWLKQMSNNISPFKAPFIFNGTLYGEVSCIEYPPNDPALGRANMLANIVCTANLNNGKQYTILAADVGGNPIASLQTTTYTVQKDDTNPDILPFELYLNPAMTLAVTNFDRWYNVPLTVVARCSDKPGISDGDECACAPEMKLEPTLWSSGIAHSEFGPDIMHYTRTISTSTSGIRAQVQDTAGNPSGTLNPIDLRIDTQAPSVTVTETPGTGSTRTIKIDVSDTLSKIWKTTDTPSGTNNVSGVIYRTGPKADIGSLMFDEDCNVSNSLYATTSETGMLSNISVTIPNINTNMTVVTYCVQDNAGNVTRGAYPTMSGGCFSASNMPTVPNFDIYKTSLISRVTNNQYGYSFSENTTDANCFRGILANNVTRLIANQLNPSVATMLDNWDTNRAIVKNTTSTRNTNGYYYYSYPTANTLNIDVPPTGSGNKTVVVEGGDIQINTNIDYSGTGKLLVLVARKNNNGQGGNIRIAPSVSRIDAILIADGGALINTDPNAAGQRLTINGRIYSYNTRGGSLVVSGSELTDASQGKKFNNATITNATSLSESRAQDLERFRVISVDGTVQCSTHLNYQVLPANQLPPILQRPTTFNGTCGF